MGRNLIKSSTHAMTQNIIGRSIQLIVTCDWFYLDSNQIDIIIMKCYRFLVSSCFFFFCRLFSIVPSVYLLPINLLFLILFIDFRIYTIWLSSTPHFRYSITHIHTNTRQLAQWTIFSCFETILTQCKPVLIAANVLYRHLSLTLNNFWKALRSTNQSTNHENFNSR